MTARPVPFDIIVVGAGAAGMMCALTAGQRGLRVLLLDHNDRAGAKILISGGGRCNFTNREAPPERFVSGNPRFATSALSRYRPADFVALVERHGVAYHEKTLGQLFCDGSARQVVALLLDECARGGVDLRLRCAITDVAGTPEGFRVTTPQGAFAARSLVLATGGPAIPKMGATAFAHEVAARFGLAVVPPRPALVPLTLGADLLDLARGLAGVAVEAVARAGAGPGSSPSPAFREALLFTHRGLSGPAALQASSYWREGGEVALDLLPGVDGAARLKAAKRARPRAEARALLRDLLPARLADALSEREGLAGRAGDPRASDLRAGDLPDRALEALAARLKAWRLAPTGTEGFAKAEVSAGGVDTAGLSSRTMEARAVPGLHVVGEAVDVTGWLGGYNFQWAWASGWAAGNAAGG